MSALSLYVDGIGLFGPGLPGWAQARTVLDGSSAFAIEAIRLPAAEALPPAERRRAGLAIKLSMAIGFEAVRAADADPALLPTVFSSTGGDCENCHNLLETLASNDRSVSPTRFHNSVHNAPAGYWSIATGCMAPSTSLCAYDATFAAGLLEASMQAVTSGKPCLLLAFDTAYPEPLNALRPIPHALGVALLLNPRETAAAQAKIALQLCRAAPTTMADAQLESLRHSVPAARSLPLLELLARRSSGRVVIEYIDALELAVEVAP
ncbi:beta-ketoacyl synthase chain length factor [Rhodocyclus tenuis]|uniref:Beta-ketoacyl synthase-like N-terminal domain-containing protein n=1 Tax=Rhodocyclus tenuis TaxID=1066 RepID=A0A840G3D3_RHOTE|nr:beta-ketoacyl synthase chain length factor [Rhodocyclus tenuis]MBB4245811.1 hypothetical protein [Rhodocyclus tenuis]